MAKPKLETALRQLADDVEWILEGREFTPQEIQRILMIKARMESVIIRLQEIVKDLCRGG
jgi:hypothetical protein